MSEPATNWGECVPFDCLYDGVYYFYVKGTAYHERKDDENEITMWFCDTCFESFHEKHVECGCCAMCVSISEMDKHSEKCVAYWFTPTAEQNIHFVNEHYDTPVNEHYDTPGECDMCDKKSVPLKEHLKCTVCPEDSKDCLGCASYCESKRCTKYDCNNIDETMTRECPYCVDCCGTIEDNFVRCCPGSGGEWQMGYFVCARCH